MEKARLHALRTLAALVLAAFALGGCEEKEALPQDHGRRQQQLSEKLLGRARRAGAEPATQQDAALALAEVVVPAHSPQLRLIAAGDDPVMAKGAAKALVKILLVREEDDRAALLRCAQGESNGVVRGECLRVLGAQARGDDVATYTQALSDADPDVRRGAAEGLFAGGSAALLDAFRREPQPVRDVASKVLQQFPPPARAEKPTRALLESSKVEERREGLRRALGVGEAELARVQGIDSALVHLLEDPDETVKLLVSAVWLRRSLSQAPPPIDPAVR